MGESMTIDAIKGELLAAENILNTEYSFEKAEPNYIQCLEIIKSAPAMRPQFAKLLTSLFDANEASDEPLAFLMHVLRWPEVRDWAEDNMRRMANPIATGRPLEKVRRSQEPSATPTCCKVLPCRETIFI